jgi:hypothetical protein
MTDIRRGDLRTRNVDGQGGGEANNPLLLGRGLGCRERRVPGSLKSGSRLATFSWFREGARALIGDWMALSYHAFSLEDCAEAGVHRGEEGTRLPSCRN